MSSRTPLSKFEQSLVGNWSLVAQGYSQESIAPKKNPLEMRINGDRTMQYLGLEWTWSADEHGNFTLASGKNDAEQALYRIAIEGDGSLIVDTRPSEGEVVRQFRRQLDEDDQTRNEKGVRTR